MWPEASADSVNNSHFDGKFSLATVGTMAKSEKFHSSPKKNKIPGLLLITSVKGFNLSKSPGLEIVTNSHKLFSFKFCY